MNTLIPMIIEELRTKGNLTTHELDRLMRKRSSEVHDGRSIYAKKYVLPYYLKEREEKSELWKSWGMDSELEKQFIKVLQMKPRRSASGVATITVITKPAPCSNSCIYCPNDPRMPKSYLSQEPACQRASRNHFHPYLQIASRLQALYQMGHATDKIELIVLGGTWLDYDEDYREWFIANLFMALNDDDNKRNDALEHEYEFLERKREIPCIEDLHRINEQADHRVVGLVVETRPDTITPENLIEMRRLGCTKIQIGVQSVNNGLLKANGRHETEAIIARAFSLLRLFGFKIHAHFMINLWGATPKQDKNDYRRFALSWPYQPDEVKLYPCALVDKTELLEKYKEGVWRPYTEEELIDVLAQNLKDTPCFTRISRMIRDISSNDILVGNKKTNLRQLVEQAVHDEDAPVQEIRYREIGTEEVDLEALTLDEVQYHTSTTEEYFLQWITPSNKIVGFLRLSLPHADALLKEGKAFPIHQGEAMIREVHVYGFATQISQNGSSAQHHGLGKALIERAVEIAETEGYTKVNVISAIGTRDYYRRLHFKDNGLYQQRDLRGDIKES